MAVPIRIKMLETRTGSPDGIRAEEYLVGETYEFVSRNGLPVVFLREGWAEVYEPAEDEVEETLQELQEDDAAEVADQPPETQQRARVEDKQKPPPVRKAPGKRRRRRT